MKSGILESLWWGWCEGTSLNGRSKEYSIATKAVGTALDVIEEVLKAAGKETVLQDFDKAWGAQLTASEKDAFRAGFRAGLTLMKEVSAS